MLSATVCYGAQWTMINSAIETVPIDQASLEAVLGFILAVDSVAVRPERKPAAATRSRGRPTPPTSCDHPYEDLCAPTP
jgi:hypothetical protein